MQKTTLILVNSVNNNNKFYQVTLDDDEITVTKRWGRTVNGADINSSPGATKIERTGRRGYDKSINEKKRKGYKVHNIEDGKVIKSTSTNQNLGEVARKTLLADPNTKKPEVLSLIDKLVAQNKHQIMSSSGGLIQINDDGVIKTALGFVDKETIHQARDILVKIEPLVNTGSNEYISLLDEYLTLIPQQVPSQRGWHNGFFAGDKLKKQFNFLEQLEQSYDWYEQTCKTALANQASKDTEELPADLFRYKIDLLEDGDKFNEIKRFYESSKNHAHGSSRLKLKRVYVLSSEQEDMNFNEKKAELGNVHQLWHGTVPANVLSILSKGLFVPPRQGGSVQITGRLFGDGVYLSNQSTKSLNYSHGYWGGVKINNCFMFLTETALGKEYRPTRSGAHADKRKSYNSLFVEPNKCITNAGNRVLNNEVIVWDTKQISLRHLCEFDV